MEKLRHVLAIGPRPAEGHITAAALCLAAMAVLAGCGADPEPPKPPHGPPEAGNAGASSQVPRRGAEPEGRKGADATAAQLSAFDSAMDEGDAALYSGQFDKARGHFLEALELKPRHMRAALGCLRSMVTLGRGEERSSMEGEIRRRMSDLMEDPQTRGAGELLAARLFMALGEPLSALTHARLAAASLPDLAEVWDVVGQAAAQGELWSKAAGATSHALELGAPSPGATLTRLADSLDELGDYVGAEARARDALAARPMSAHQERRRRNLLAVILKHQGKSAHALEEGRRALALGPHDPAVLHNLATIEEARGEFGRAEGLYGEALKATPVPMTSWRLGHLLLKQDRRSEAVRALTDAAGRLDQWSWPQSTRWWPAYDVGRIYALAGHDRESIGWFEDAMREARGRSSMGQVRSWLTWARVQAGLENEPQGAPVPDPGPGIGH